MDRKTIGGERMSKVKKKTRLDAATSRRERQGNHWAREILSVAAAAEVD